MVGIALVVFAAAAGMFLDNVIGAIFNALKWNNATLLGESMTLSAVVGFVVAIAAAIYIWFSASLREGGLEIAAELKRVTWPSMAETRVSTIAVVIASLVAAIILFFFDFIASKAMTIWVPAGLRFITGV